MVDLIDISEDYPDWLNVWKTSDGKYVITENVVDKFDAQLRNASGEYPFCEGEHLFHVFDNASGEGVFSNRKSLDRALGDLERIYNNPDEVDVSYRGHKVHLKTGKLYSDVESSRQGYGIDAEIRDIVYELNLAGFVTNSSCSGHGRSKAFIGFESELTASDKIAVIGLISQFGGEKISFRGSAVYFDL